MKIFKLNNNKVTVHIGNKENITSYLEMNGLPYHPFTIIKEGILAIDEDKIYEIDTIRGKISDELFHELEETLEI